MSCKFEIRFTGYELQDTSDEQQIIAAEGTEKNFSANDKRLKTDDYPDTD